MLASIIGLLFTANASLLTVPIVHAAPLSVAELKAIATSTAARYHLTEKQTERMLKVVACESGWDTEATGALGERGLAQIYPKAHPTIPESDMVDPYFALDFLAKNLFKHPSWWSCYALTGT